MDSLLFDQLFILEMETVIVSRKTPRLLYPRLSSVSVKAPLDNLYHKIHLIRCHLIITGQA